MKAILMITLAAGPQGVLQPGNLYQVDDTLADGLFAGRYAVLAPIGSSVEVAAVEPPERAVVQRPQRSKRIVR
jgi:hypothetical protein